MQDIPMTSAEPRLVEVVLTEEQAGLVAAATDVTLRSHEDPDGLVTLSEEEELGLKQLAVFFVTVASNPQHFPVTGRMARTIKSRQPKAPKPEAGNTGRSVKNQRKARQERRRAFHKLRRKDRKANAELFNMARADMEKAMQEQQAEVERRQAEIENEPKFDVTDILGNVVIAGVPASMIRHAGEADQQVHADAELIGHAQDARDAAVPKIILPGSAEHLGVELETN